MSSKCPREDKSRGATSLQVTPRPQQKTQGGRWLWVLQQDRGGVREFPGAGVWSCEMMKLRVSGILI